MDKDNRLIISSNLINGFGYFIFTSLFLILFVKEGFNTFIYSVIYATSLIIEAGVLFFNPRMIPESTAGDKAIELWAPPTWSM